MENGMSLEGNNLGDLYKGIDNLSLPDRKALGSQLGAGLNNQQTGDLYGSIISSISDKGIAKMTVNKAIQQLPAEKKKEAATELMRQLNASDQKEVVQQSIGAPGERTRDYLWLIIVSAFTIVLVGTFITLAIGVFQAPEKDAITKPELILTMFTSVVGFLAGLFAPSPAARQQGR